MTIQRKIHRTDGYPEILVEMRNGAGGGKSISVEPVENGKGALVITIDTAALAAELAPKLGKGAISSDAIRNALEDSDILSREYFDGIVKTCDAGGIDCFGSEVTLMKKSMKDIADVISSAIKSDIVELLGSSESIGEIAKTVNDVSNKIDTANDKIDNANDVINTSKSAIDEIKKALVGAGTKSSRGMAGDVADIKEALEKKGEDQTAAHKAAAGAGIKEVLGYNEKSKELTVITSSVSKGIEQGQRGLAGKVAEHLGSNANFASNIAGAIEKKDAIGRGTKMRERHAGYQNWSLTLSIIAIAFSLLGVFAGKMEFIWALFSLIACSVGLFVRAIKVDYGNYWNYKEALTTAAKCRNVFMILPPIIGIVLMILGFIF